MPAIGRIRRGRTRAARRAAILWAAALWAACAPARATPLSDEIERLLSENKYATAVVGVHVVAAETGRVIYALDANRCLIVASNQKLLTAAAALETLGTDYNFTTALHGRGTKNGPTLHGDLILRGGGDPTIGGTGQEEDALGIFRRWAAALKQEGLERLSGDVIADDRFFDRVYRHPAWPEGQAWKRYYPTVGALSVNDNCVTVKVRPGPAAGAPTIVSLWPEGAPVTLENACKTSQRRNAVWFQRAVGDSRIRVGGYLPKTSHGYFGPVTVPDPSLYAAAAFRQVLEAEGIAVEGKARVVAADEGDLLDGAVRLYVRKAPLLPVLRTMARESHNHYAEQVLKTIGAEATGRGSWESGLKEVAGILERRGFQRSEFSLADGSGLSRDNQLTPALITGLLSTMHRSERGRVFASLLAVAGQSGTLSKRLTGKPYRGKVRAKTGYLNGVGALSGYATTRGGIVVAFAILVNEPEKPGAYSMRGTVDSLCRAIVDHAR